MFLTLHFPLWSTTGVHQGEYGCLDPCLDFKRCNCAIAFIASFFFLLNEPLLLSLSMFLDCFEPWATLMA